MTIRRLTQRIQFRSLRAAHRESGRSIPLSPIALVLFLLSGLLGGLTHGEEPPPLTLEQLLDEALRNNPELRALSASADAARGEVVTAATWQNPELSVSPKLTHTRSEGGRSSNQFDKEIGLSQTIEFPGKRALRRAVAEKNVEIRELALAGFRSQLSNQVRSAFYRLLVSEQLVSLKENRLTIAKTFVEAARKKVDAGYAPEFEATKAEVERVAAEKELREAQAQRQASAVALTALLGRTPTRSLTVSGDLARDLPSPDEATLLAEASLRNPSLRIQAVEVERTSLGVDLARRSRFPDFTIGPSYETEPDTQFYTLGLSLPLPFWDRKQGEIVTAEAERRRAAAELQKLQQEILRDILTSSQDLAAAKAGLASYTPQLFGKLIEALDAASRGYPEGRTPLLLFLETQRTFFDTQAGYLETLQKLYEARAALEAAVGVPLAELATPHHGGKSNK